MSCKEAIQAWQEKTGLEPSEAKEVKLICCLPSIRKMDASLGVLTSCEKLSMSTNAIDQIRGLTGLKRLRILSLGRNNIKRIEKLEDVANTLEELWLSYNSIEKLDGLTGMRRLRVLYLSNNGIKSWDELLKLRDLPALEELLLVGNPIYTQSELSSRQCRLEVIRRLPKLKKLDATPVSEQEREDVTLQEQKS